MKYVFIVPNSERFKKQVEQMDKIQNEYNDHLHRIILIGDKGKEAHKEIREKNIALATNKDFKDANKIEHLNTITRMIQPVLYELNSISKDYNTNLSEHREFICSLPDIFIEADKYLKSNEKNSKLTDAKMDSLDKTLELANKDLKIVIQKMEEISLKWNEIIKLNKVYVY